MEEKKYILRKIIILTLLFHFAYSYTVAQSSGFKKLGEIRVRNDNNQDDIIFNNLGLPIYQFQFLVKTGAVGFDKIVIVKKDGTKEEINYKIKLLDQTESKIFTLTNMGSPVSSIKLWHTVRPNDKAKPVVEVFGILSN